MPKGIRKACANCIKARLACDEGRPCQRCVVHACECVAVPRKPRVKKQKLDMEPPPVVADSKHNIPAIDTNADVVVPNWSPNEFAQGTFGAFQLDRGMQDEAQFDGCAPNSTLSPKLSLPLLMDTSYLSTQLPSPPQVYGSPTSPTWTQKQIQAALAQLSQQQQQQQQSSSTQQAQLPPPSITPIGHPIQPVHIQPSQQQQQRTAPQQLHQTLQQQQQQHVHQAQQASQQQDIKPLLRHTGYDTSQMLSLLLEEKPSTLLSDWQDGHLGAAGPYLVDGQGQNIGFFDPTLFTKKHLTPQLSNLPQPMNATPLYPAPIAVFDKVKFQLLDSNHAMAQFVGVANVAELSTKVTCMDDLLDRDAAQVAKQAYTNFVTNPTPCFRLGEIRTHGGSSSSKTVEFHVDLTEQLLILTIKSVFDNSSKALPDVQYQHMSIKPDPTPSHLSMQQFKAFEFLSPID